MTSPASADASAGHGPLNRDLSHPPSAVLRRTGRARGIVVTPLSPRERGDGEERSKYLKKLITFLNIDLSCSFHFATSPTERGFTFP